MKTIACLAWGSLTWDPGELPIRRKWYDDGPMVRVEFLRRSNGGRLTLVLHKSALPVRSLWALMDLNEIDPARKALRARERIGRDKPDNWIGSWKIGDAAPDCIIGLDAWAASHGLDAVIWTALPAKFHGNDGEIPPEKDTVAYLEELRGAERDVAERYIRRAPQQIDTEYRRRFEAAFGWTYQG